MPPLSLALFGTLLAETSGVDARLLKRFEVEEKRGFGGEAPKRGLCPRHHLPFGGRFPQKTKLQNKDILKITG